MLTPSTSDAVSNNTRKRGRIVEVSTLLDCTAERAYEEVQRSKLLEYITAPLVRFEPLEPKQFPETWQEGNYLVRIHFFGVLPIGTQSIGIEKPFEDAPPYRIFDNGHGQLMEVWHHLITIAPTPNGKTHYTDRVEIQAGILTVFVWALAHIFYRHRQRRWRKLVARGFRYS